jgi:outer membrane protein TolC
MAVLYERLDVAKRELAGAQNQLAAALGRPVPAPEAPPPPQPGLLRRIRHDPRIRAVLTRVPGARSAVLAARRWRADRAGR